MHYSNNPGHVRIDFFRPDRNGKWYMTEALDMGPFYNFPQISVAFRVALAKHFMGAMTFNWRGRDTQVICLEPHHENAHPLSITLSEEETRRCEGFYAEYLEDLRLGS
ncbi:hypothetical protein LCGC14_1559540 [marine sediment metagenome]|uniref:Uncharacterized protein n=1 Tax=marine sediment metagenome TaxID=412755 RepID=A0A0F9L4B5_9ZZZZ